MEKLSNKIFVAPEIWLHDRWWDELILFLWGSLGLSLTATVTAIFLSGMGWGGNQLNMGVNFLSYAIIFFGCLYYLFLLKPELGKVILDGFKKDHWNKILFGFVIFSITNLVSSIYIFFVQRFGPGYMADNINQQSLDSVSVYVLPFVLMTVLFAPVCEELCYRVGLCSLLARGNKIAALVITALVFGFLHFNWNSIGDAMEGSPSSLINELWNLPTYLLAGIGLGAAYLRYGCFTASWSGHMTNNLLATIQMYV